MFISAALRQRIKEIPLENTLYPNNMAGNVIRDFGLFVDTHRDQPHVGSFHSDIHRGFSRPTWVDYEPSTQHLVEVSTGQELVLHEKHMFVTDEWFSDFLVERMMNGDGDPRDSDGILATSHLRDARAKVYHLKSFRQIVMDIWAKEKAGTRVIKPR